MAELRDTENADIGINQSEEVLRPESPTLTRPLLNVRAPTLTSLPLAQMSTELSDLLR